VNSPGAISGGDFLLHGGATGGGELTFHTTQLASRCDLLFRVGIGLPQLTKRHDADGDQSGALDNAGMYAVDHAPTVLSDVELDADLSNVPTPHGYQQVTRPLGWRHVVFKLQSGGGLARRCKWAFDKMAFKGISGIKASTVGALITGPSVGGW